MHAIISHKKLQTTHPGMTERNCKHHITSHKKLLHLHLNCANAKDSCSHYVPEQHLHVLNSYSHYAGEKAAMAEITDGKSLSCAQC